MASSLKLNCGRWKRGNNHEVSINKSLPLDNVWHSCTLFKSRRILDFGFILEARIERNVLTIHMLIKNALCDVLKGLVIKYS